MFIQGTRAGVGRLADYQSRAWKLDDWLYLARQKAAGATIIPGVSNTTAAAVGGGSLLALGAAYMAAKYFKIL